MCNMYVSVCVCVSAHMYVAICMVGIRVRSIACQHGSLGLLLADDSGFLAS